MGFLQKICLKETYTLRKQLFMSFGSTAILSVLIVVGIRFVLMQQLATYVKSNSIEITTGQMKRNIVLLTRYVGESTSMSIEDLKDSAALLSEAVRDRFVGYPDDGFEDDRYVPFRDSISGNNIYPLDSPPLPFDWNLKSNVNDQNSAELLQGRHSWYPDALEINTKYPIYFMQGMCNPTSRVDGDAASQRTYYKNCTTENNDVRTGGKVHPTKTNELIYEKAGDLSFLLKAMYESDINIRSIGVYFANEGAGSFIRYPGYVLNSNGTYTSIGCDWMRTPNPLDPNVGPIGTEEEIARCHRENQTVLGREFNGLETEWCREQALNPQAGFVGGHLYGEEGGAWFFSMGKAVYDRRTKKFIACTLLDVPVQPLNVNLKELAMHITTVFTKDTPPPPPRGNNQTGSGSNHSEPPGNNLEGTLGNDQKGIPGNDQKGLAGNDQNGPPGNNQEGLPGNNLDSGLSNQFGFQFGPQFGQFGHWAPQENLQNAASFALVKSDGKVIASSDWDTNASQSNNFYITELEESIGVDYTTFNHIKVSWNHSKNIKDEEQILISNDKYIAFYPLPTPPRIYDEMYSPDFFIIGSFDASGVLTNVDEINQAIDSLILRLFKYNLLASGVGLCIVLVIIGSVSHAMTKPLTVLRKMAKQIVDNAGGDLSEGLNDADYVKTMRCTPKTELTVLWSDFANMLGVFSGGGCAKVATANVNEVKNEFRWENKYKSLYNIADLLAAVDTEQNKQIGGSKNGSILHDLHRQSFFLRNQGDSHHSTTKTASSTERAVSSSGKIPIPSTSGHTTTTDTALDDASTESFQGNENTFPRMNRKRNVVQVPDQSDDMSTIGGIYKTNSFKSPLFRYIALSISIPLLLTMGVINELASTYLYTGVRENLVTVTDVSRSLETMAIILTSESRARYLEVMVNKASRELRIYSRVAGWLLLGGLRQSKSYTDMISGVEECKIYYPNYRTCPYFQYENSSTICDCDWQEAWEERSVDGHCTDYHYDTRYVQKQWYMGQSQDANPETGDRLSTSFPKVDRYPNETMWWNSTATLPGYSSRTASGYNTTYDRMRALSAMSIVEFPLYNYHRRERTLKPLGTYVGFEADGMLMGYTGCDHHYIAASGYQAGPSTANNNRNDQFCPENKYGFDPRCQDWYNMGRQNKDTLQYFPNLSIRSGKMNVSTATMSLTDPETGSYIGQTRMDINNEWMFDLLAPDTTTIGQGENGFALLMTLSDVSFSEDFVVGPGQKKRRASSAFDLISSVDISECDEANNLLYDFGFVVEQMKNKRRMATNFCLGKVDGGGEEVLIAYAPVFMTSSKPVSPSDFSRGVITSQIPLYSLGIAVPTSDLDLPFLSTREKINRFQFITRTSSIVFMVVTLLLLTFITYNISISILCPIIGLTEILRKIKKGSLKDEVPELESGSLEVSQVNDSFEKLYKVVYFSSTQFTSQNARHSIAKLREATDLFHNLGNQKALAIASNNLGTILLGQFLSGMFQGGDDEVGLRCFNEAIRIGIMEMDEKNLQDDPIRHSDYCRQLANRYFNRGIFHIIAYGNINNGTEDILAAKGFDEKSLALWKGLGSSNHLEERDSEFFDSILGRVRGMGYLMRNHGFKDLLNMKDLIEQGEEILLNNWNKPNATFFRHIRRVGRSQQLLDLRAQYESLHNNLAESAKISLRMLVEDEYIIDTAFANAVFFVNQHFKSWTKNVMFCLDCSASMSGDKLRRAREHISFIYENHCSSGDFIGYLPFNNKVPASDNVCLPQRKAEFSSHHRFRINQRIHACGGSNLYMAINSCVNMIASIGMNHSWIIALTDGESWDEPDNIYERLFAWNSKYTNKIHVILIGFGIPKRYVKKCKLICTVSAGSLYIDARDGLRELEKAFKQSKGVICGGGGVTLETY